MSKIDMDTAADILFFSTSVWRHTNKTTKKNKRTYKQITWEKNPEWQEYKKTSKHNNTMIGCINSRQMKFTNTRLDSKCYIFLINKKKKNKIKPTITYNGCPVVVLMSHLPSNRNLPI